MVIGDLTERLEMLGDQDRLEGADELVAKLHVEFARVRGLLEEYLKAKAA